MPKVTRPVFSESLKKLLKTIDCPVAEKINGVIGLDWSWDIALCDCDECEPQNQKHLANRGSFNQDCGMNYFSFREKEGQISFIPSNKEQAFKDGDPNRWERKGRQEITPGRWAQRILSERISQSMKSSEWGRFTEMFLAREQEGKLKFEKVPIQVAYNSPVHSCMTNKPVGPFYEQFDCVGLIAKEYNDIVARAILWNDVQGQKVKAPLLDRVYATSPQYMQAMLDYARDQMWYTKAKQGAADASVTSLLVDAEGDCRKWTIPRANESKDIDFFPYIDTFFYSDKDMNTLGFTPIKKGWKYQNQSGGRERCQEGLKPCYHCSELYDPETEMTQHRGRWYATEHMGRCRYTNELLPYGLVHRVSPPGEEPFYVAASLLNQQ